MRECLVGECGAGEECVAAKWWQFAGEQQGAERWNLIVGVIRVSVAADVHRLVRFLAYFGDLRVIGNRFEESSDVNHPERLGEGDLLLRRERLFAKKQYAVPTQRLLEFLRLSWSEILQVDTRYFCAQRADGM